MINICCKFLAESKGKKILKIGKNLAKLCTENIVGLFLTHSVEGDRCNKVIILLIIFAKHCDDIQNNQQKLLRGLRSNPLLFNNSCCVCSAVYLCVRYTEVVVRLTMQDGCLTRSFDSPSPAVTLQLERVVLEQQWRNSIPH